MGRYLSEAQIEAGLREATTLGYGRQATLNLLDAQRHRVMKGHPPTGEIFPPMSEAEKQRRMLALREHSRGLRL